MLKVQLRSKIAALGLRWQDFEDILTGDFFGVLDYLPRQPFLRSFLEWVALLNADAGRPSCDAITWDAVEFIFWPMITGEDESAEPDVVIVSDRWAIVVEVKLDSGLGSEQPWREYCVGREIARERGIPAGSVYYLLVARERLDVARTFVSHDDPDRNELLANTSYLLWHQVVALVERWLKPCTASEATRPEHQRMLVDLLAALRRRRSLAFSGFAFTNQEPVSVPACPIFCCDRFTGFLRDSKGFGVTGADTNCFLSRFAGFLDSAPEVEAAGPVFACSKFLGFMPDCPRAEAPIAPILSMNTFPGFLLNCLRCVPASTLRIFPR